MSERIKIIGNRRPATSFEQAAAFLDTVIALRGDRPFIPKGYYRFKTFEEAQDWSICMMARAGRRTPDDGRQPEEDAGRQTPDAGPEKKDRRRTCILTPDT